MSKEFAHIALTNASREVDQTYTYRVPEEKRHIIEIGMKVLVPFGTGNRLMEGIVFSFSETCSYSRIKPIRHILDEDIAIDEKQLDLIQWIRKRYLCTYSDALQAVMPSGTSLRRITTYSIGQDVQLDEAQQKDLHLLLDAGGHTREELYELSDYKLKKYMDSGMVIKTERFETGVSDQIKNRLQLKVDRAKALAAIPASNSAQIRVVNYLARRKNSVLQSEVTKACRVGTSVLKKLEDAGFIETDTVQVMRTPTHYTRNEKSNVILNAQQQEAFDRIDEIRRENAFRVFLLNGVTGSGKTEVYMNLTEEVLASGRQSLVLVPEISLTPQIVSKFISRFGAEVAVFHSKLSLGERFDQWKAVQRGELNIIIGARSALFAPFKELGLIILDEEHDTAYKSDQNPKYKATDVAKHLGSVHGAPVVLGSATPSLESVERVKSGEYDLLELTSRFNDQVLPEVKLVDMREELAMGNRSIFSDALFEAITERLKKKEQVILFLNRKGHSTFVSCRSCGFSLKCPNCEIALTYHKNDGRATCHYCGYSIHVPARCPSCNSGYFKFFGTGTEKVEELTRAAFPQARIDRLDRQSVSRKGSMESILDRFDKHETDILIGTQMVTKGLDFENVTLVGVLSADVLLNLPDFQSGERAFQLLTQVAGRAGRGELAGEVIIQTYTPEHYAVQAACQHDHAQFVEEEARLRVSYNYPPYRRLSNILISGEDEAAVIKTAQRLFEPIQREFIKNKLKKVQVLGPNPAIYSKIKGRYRWQILIKSSHEDEEMVSEVLRAVCMKDRNKYCVGETAVSVDIDAVNIL